MEHAKALLKKLRASGLDVSEENFPVYFDSVIDNGANYAVIERWTETGEYWVNPVGNPDRFVYDKAFCAVDRQHEIHSIWRLRRNGEWERKLVDRVVIVWAD